jgi:tRNA modification GTPase
MSTIIATITSPIRSAICVIRISGPQTLQCLQALGVKNEPRANYSFFHKIIFDDKNFIVDEAIITYYQAPKSFTGEDIAEISIHNSPFIIKEIFAKLLSIKNVDLAQAGEFAKRAVLNNKLDLVQAEAIPDLIASETISQHRQAITQLQGKLGQIYQQWSQKIIEISAIIEALIDFPDDDLPPDLIEFVNNSIINLKQQISSHLNDNKIGQKIKDGLKLAIIGSPNAGKSSLINYLANSEIAIVSPIEGTTRDIINTHLQIAGISVIISDTAGLRASDNLIEQEGIKRAKEKAQNCDLILQIIDATNPIFHHDFLGENTILIFNKIDLLNPDFNKILAQNNLPKDYPYLAISIEQKLNLDSLINALETNLLKLFPQSQAPTITQERYRVAIQNCLNHLEKINLDCDIELSAENLRISLNEIAKITGKVGIEEILDVVFSKFCIGK